MSMIAIEIFILVILVVVNGVLAMSEMAIVSSRRVRLDRFADEGRRGAAVAVQLAEDPSRFLSTVQIGITLVGIFAGVYGGATLAEPLADFLASIAGAYADEIAMVVVVVAITTATLIGGELVPKRLALTNPERIAAAMARPMLLLSKLAAPLVSVLSWATDLIVRAFGLRESEDPPVTQEEVSSMIRTGARTGVFEREEHAIVERVFRFSDLAVRAIMTPRREILYLDLDNPPESITRTLTEAVHTRYVVCRGDIDHALGVVNVKVLLAQCLETGSIDLHEVLRPVLFIPETVPALRLLERFKRTGEQTALLMDEYGGVSGLVTLDDILEAIVGNIPWSGEAIEPEIIPQADGSWLVEGMTNAAELKRHFGIRALSGDDVEEFSTAGGFVTSHLGRIPAEGDRFTFDRYLFEVVLMDGNRVDTLRLAPLESESGEEA